MVRTIERRNCAWDWVLLESAMEEDLERESDENDGPAVTEKEKAVGHWGRRLVAEECKRERHRAFWTKTPEWAFGFYFLIFLCVLPYHSWPLLPIKLHHVSLPFYGLFWKGSWHAGWHLHWLNYTEKCYCHVLMKFIYYLTI